MHKLSFGGSGGSELPPSPSPSGQGTGRREWWESTPTLPLPLRGGYWEEGVVGVNSHPPPPPPGRVLGGGSGGSQLPPSPSPSGQGTGRREWWESTPTLPLLLPVRGGYWEEGVVGVNSRIPKLLNRFVLVKKKRDTQKIHTDSTFHRGDHCGPAACHAQFSNKVFIYYIL